MPCTSESNWERENREQKEKQKLREELNLVTRLLCEVMSDPDNHINVKSELKDWFQKHEAFDKKRLEQEIRNKLNSLNLTDKEKEVMKELLKDKK
jgi:hypothetical protein